MGSVVINSTRPGASQSALPVLAGSPELGPRDELRQHGLRVTAQRLAVLAAVEHHQHIDADTVLRRVRDSIGSVSVQGVYDALNALTDAGLLRRIEPAGHPTRYERRVGDNHHHMVCRHCGAVVDVDCAVGKAPCLEASDDHGFIVDTAEVTYWGACPSCQEL